MTHAGPSLGDSAPVHILHALPMCRKKRAVMLTNQEQINQIQTCREKTNALSGPYCESDTSNKANDSTNCTTCKMKFYDTNKAQVDWIQCTACKLWLHKTNTSTTDNDCNQQQSYDESFINFQLLKTVQYSKLFCLFSSLYFVQLLLHKHRVEIIKANTYLYYFTCCHLTPVKLASYLMGQMESLKM
jgi:hypothetical protein